MLSAVSDELFTPTIKARPVPTKPPWRPESIVYPAFFGGPLAATVLGLINGRRLLLGSAQLWLIAATGLACFAGRLAAAMAWDSNSVGRLGGSIAGIAVWAVVNFLQRRPMRLFLHNDGEPASLIGPGIAAAIGCGLIEVLIIVAVAR